MLICVLKKSTLESHHCPGQNLSVTCEKVTSDLQLGFGGGFPWVHRFPPPVTTGKSQFSRNMSEKVAKNEIRNSTLECTFKLRQIVICGNINTVSLGR